MGQLKQCRVPGALLGRVSSIGWLVSTALLPLSYALTLPVAHLLGARTTLVLAGTIGAAVTLGFLFRPGMRRSDREEGAALSPSPGWDASFDKNPDRIDGSSPRPGTRPAAG